MENREKKRLVVELTQQEHKEIKMRATFRNITIKDWVKLAIFDRIKSEQQYE